MRAIWKGFFSCSLVTIPVKMFITVTIRPLQFHLYRKACGSRINAGQTSEAKICRDHLREAGVEM
jgi:non-homologous end joining protein Ku